MSVKLHYTVDGGDFVHAGEASSQMKMALRKLGIAPDLIRRASICMYEGEINMVIHANGGEAFIEVDLERITIRLTDTGQGIADIGRAMEEGYSTANTVARDLGFGAGMGLPNMKRHSDDLQIRSKVGEGTTVIMQINIA